MAPKALALAPQQPLSIESYLEQQQGQDLLRFITCGSVDDGKSTLIGRLLWDSRHLTDDQLANLKSESRKYGTQGADIDFALLVDGLSAEREQGITIDVAYRYFATAKRKFIVADTPGHEQYTRNMVTGASTADVAVILVDARQGVLTQTRRHAYLASLMGIRHVALAVNKMDLVNFDQDTYQRIVESFQAFAQPLGFMKITALPVSALKGDNITQRSAHTPWYNGPTLMGYLETAEVSAPQAERLVFPVQWVNRPNDAFRGFSGYVGEGQVKVGDEIRVTLSGQTATVTDIVSMDGSMQQAGHGDAVTLKLDREIDASRGDIISLSRKPLETTDQFEATLVWMDEEAGLHGRNYDIKLASQWASASITTIKYRVDINTLAHDASTQLLLNDISVCTLALSKPLVYDSYQHSKTLGSFILVDRISNATVAAGMITHSLRRAQNVHKQALSISRENREKLNGHKGKVIWFTGLSGSGKSTLANALEVDLHAKGYRTYLLDGDNVRQGLNKDLGFTDADRVENIRRIAEVAKLMMDAGMVVMTAFISPFRRERQMARELIGEENFVEVYVSTPLEVCEQRDVKGLYKKARAGQLPNLSGVGSPYEAPLAAEIEVGSDGMNIRETIEKVVDTIKS
jgi:bifunctional enzyme CysN/CysC